MASPVISVTNEREIQPFQLSIEQLSALKTQHEEELQELQKQMESLYDANSRWVDVEYRSIDTYKLIYNQENLIWIFSLNSKFIVVGFLTFDIVFRFSNARSTLADISTCSDSTRILIPLNSSLYVPGVIQQSDKVCLFLFWLLIIFTYI